MRAGIKRFVRAAAGRPLRATGLLLLTFALAGALLVGTRKPQLEREWVEHLALTPAVEMRRENFAVAPVMDWSYGPDGPAAKTTTAFAAEYEDLNNIWFVLEPQPGGEYAAHTLVLFEFAGDRIVGLTVEARREADEAYDPLRGLFNTYELAYVWSTARELLTRRAVFLDKDVYVYPLRLTPQQEIGFLRTVLSKTRALADKPRFYNTLTSNCTNELAKAADLGWHYSWVLTGYSPRWLFDLGLIPGETLPIVRERARMTVELRRLNASASAHFDRQLLSELRRRHGEGAAGSAALVPTAQTRRVVLAAVHDADNDDLIASESIGDGVPPGAGRRAPGVRTDQCACSSRRLSTIC